MYIWCFKKTYVPKLRKSMSGFNLEGNYSQKNVNEDGKFFNENLLGHNFTLKKKDNFGSKSTLIQWQNEDVW